MKEITWLDKIAEALKELRSDSWPKCSSVPVAFSPYYRVGLGPDAKKNLKYVFGDSFTGRFRNQIKNLRKFDWPKKSYRHVDLTLPSDSIVFYQDFRERLIIVSKDLDIVLKISVSKDQLSLLDGEVALMKELSSSKFAPYITEYVETGSSLHESRWIITRFKGNLHSLRNFPWPEQFLLQNIKPLILEPLVEFYKFKGVTEVTVGGWMKTLDSRLVLSPKIASEINRFSDFTLLNVQLHFDLHAGNLLYEDQKITFIDWEVTTRGLVLIDILDFYRRYLKTDSFEERKFWNFLDGQEDVPPKLKKLFMDLNNWLDNHFQRSIPENALRLIFVLYAFERANIYYKKWNEVRLDDQKGFESKILSILG